MKTYFAIYNDNYTKRQFVIVAENEIEAASIAYVSEIGVFLDGTKSYPRHEDFRITEIKGVFSRSKKSGIIQYV